MQVLVLTSRQLAPQEEWIFRGVKHLMEVSFHNSMNWIIYDLNPDLSSFDGTHYAHKRNLISNSFHHQSLRPFQAVVVAGGTRWATSQTDALYGMLANTDIPLFALGLQMPKQARGLTDHELACFQKHTTVLTAIDSTAKYFFSRYDLVPSILPCPSLFCTPGVEDRERNGKPAFVLQAEGAVHSTVGESTARSTLSYLRNKKEEFEIYCPTVDDYFRFGPLIPCKYVYDSAHFLNQLRTAPFVVTSDLTIACAANAFLAPTILITEKTESPVKELPYVFPTQLEHLDEKIALIRKTSFYSDILEWKESLRRKWISTIQNEAQPNKQPFTEKAA